MFVVPLRPKDAQALAELARQYYEATPQPVAEVIKIPEQRVDMTLADRAFRGLRAAIRL